MPSSLSFSGTTIQNCSVDSSLVSGKRFPLIQHFSFSIQVSIRELYYIG